MTKLSRKKVNLEKFGYYINNLWSAFTLMDSKEDIRLLFKDLFTHTEYKMFAKRLEIARQLLQGSSYEAIEDELSVTSHTISRINNVLNEKGEGLRKANDKLERLEERYRKIEMEKIKSMENPLLRKFNRKTVLGEALKGGVKLLDKKITQSIRQNSAKKTLKI
jgi:TrpR-related protein YerC/YecD